MENTTDRMFKNVPRGTRTPTLGTSSPRGQRRSNAAIREDGLTFGLSSATSAEPIMDRGWISPRRSCVDSGAVLAAYESVRIRRAGGVA